MIEMIYKEGIGSGESQKWSKTARLNGRVFSVKTGAADALTKRFKNTPTRFESKA
jgi:hypothetical protein